MTKVFFYQLNIDLYLVMANDIAIFLEHFVGCRDFISNLKFIENLLIFIHQ